MKEIKAFIHRNRVGDVVQALSQAGFCSDCCNLSIVDVKGTLTALDNIEQDYSAEMGGRIITEVKLELVCDDERADEAVRIIWKNGRTGQRMVGWVYVVDIGRAYGTSELLKER